MIRRSWGQYPAGGRGGCGTGRRYSWPDRCRSVRPSTPQAAGRAWNLRGVKSRPMVVTCTLSRSEFVFVDQAAEDGVAANPGGLACAMGWSGRGGVRCRAR